MLNIISLEKVNPRKKEKYQNHKQDYDRLKGELHH